jgi:hypothetical protein
MFAQSIYDSLIVFTMELDSVVVTAKSRGFYQDMTKRDKKVLIERFKARVKADFPQEKNTYNILTDLFVGRDNQTVAKGKLKGELTVIPNASYKKGEDSIRVEGKLVSGYVNEQVAAEMEKLGLCLEEYIQMLENPAPAEREPPEVPVEEMSQEAAVAAS